MLSGAYAKEQPSGAWVPEATGREDIEVKSAGELLPESIPPYRGETYYDIPPLKPSHYKWRTSVAFFFNGIGGGSQILATLVDWMGSEQDRRLVRAGRMLAFAGGSLSTVTLISALHTPKRWYNMLRLFKKTSPMSIGIWAITPFTLLSGLTVAGQIAEDFGYEKTGRWMGRIFSLPAALLGGMVVTYMGTELEETNMPIWASAHPLLAPLYASTGLSDATAALSLAAQRTDATDGLKRSLKRLGLVSGAVELVLAAMLERRWSRLPEARAFERSRYASLFRGGFLGAGLTLPLALRGLGAVGNGSSGASAGLGTVESLLKLAGGLLLQFVLVYAGRESGRHARDYFEYTKPRRLDGGSGNGWPRLAKEASAAPFEDESARGSEPVSRPKASRSALVGLGLFAFGAALLIGSRGGKRGESR